MNRIARLGSRCQQKELSMNTLDSFARFIEHLHMIFIFKARFAMYELDLILFKLAEQYLALFFQYDIQSKVELIDGHLPNDARLGIKTALVKIGKIQNRFAQRFRGNSS